MPDEFERYQQELDKAERRKMNKESERLVPRQIDESSEVKMKYPDGNPKTLYGIVKPGFHHTPYIPLMEYSLVHQMGAMKYGPFNWRDDPVSISTYLDAAERHIAKYRAGMQLASDSGLHELAHAMTCLSIVIDAEYHGTLIDDRWKPRESGSVCKVDPGEVLDNYIESQKPRIQFLHEQWAGYKEKMEAQKK